MRGEVLKKIFILTMLMLLIVPVTAFAEDDFITNPVSDYAMSSFSALNDDMQPLNVSGFTTVQPQLFDHNEKGQGVTVGAVTKIKLDFVKKDTSERYYSDVIYVKHIGTGAAGNFTVSYFSDVTKKIESKNLGTIQPGVLTPININKVTGITYGRASGSLESFFELYIYGILYPQSLLDPSYFLVNDLSYQILDESRISLNWSKIDNVLLDHYEVYVNDELVSTTLQNSFVLNKTAEQMKVSVSAADKHGTLYTPSELNIIFSPPDVDPPSIPIDLKVETDIYQSVLKWKLNEEQDLAGYWIYLNDQKVNTSLIKNNNFTLNSLSPDTEYIVYIVAVDTTGNVSDPSAVVKFKTKSISSAPEIAPVLSGYVGNGTANLSWNSVQYATGYEVYQDSEVIAETNATRLNLKKLQNSQTYDFYVVATNEIGSSPSSNILSLTPNEKLMPDITFGYSLKDVTDGVSSWFKSYWLILAFCIAIPLSFWIGNRLKGLMAN
ncbi:Exoglucanase B precursor [compost metagenome]